MKRINCFGKINTPLLVGPPRKDGFHEIVTVYRSISLYDTLHIGLTAKSGIKLSVPDSAIPSDRRNLVWQAAEKLISFAGYSGGVSIRIEKRIPAGGGLGGGSSDAAGTLRLLNLMLNSPLSEKDLMSLAVSLGSDVPFFLVGGIALGTGHGELVRALPGFDFFRFIAVFPDIPFPTGEMYRLLDLKKKFLPERDFRNVKLEKGIHNRHNCWENTFDRVVSDMSGKVADVMGKIREQGFFVTLAGSGSTFLVSGGAVSFSELAPLIPEPWKMLELKTISRVEALGGFFS
ncbi:MAG: 4-(cytidine 5'-diphospho)-2-C-methyl-D-erythritol kinase [Acidobacteria bacterium]|nr:4-(cytidine 5'-diphospho)-2-C-methyl-D-erythritol kinase [Acidobacteriota bacterium]